MVGHIALEMQHLRFQSEGSIQERVGYEHLESEREKSGPEKGWKVT